VTVAALAAGDVFGENSFFSGAARNATVEAVEDGTLIEIGPDLYERVMQSNPRASSLIQRYYKERILDRLLATSPTFGLLSQGERRELLGKMTLRSFDPGFRIFARGSPCKAVVLVKRGQVDVSEEPDGEVVETKGPGSIVGDLEAVSGEASATSLAAGTDVEAFVLRATDLVELVDRQEGRRSRWTQAAKGFRTS
jgi:CRP-like cAMP-binding protein